MSTLRRIAVALERIATTLEAETPNADALNRQISVAMHREMRTAATRAARKLPTQGGGKLFTR